MLNTVLFDFDGTLADTYPIIFRAFKAIFKHYKNAELSDQQIVSLFGPAEPEIIQNSLPEYDQSKILDHYYQVYDRDHDLVTTHVPEVNQYLKQLVQKKIKIGIITGKGRKSLDISLEHLFHDITFDITIAGDEVENPKPHPEALLAAMQTLDSHPDHTIFIGDSDFDIKAGRAAGIPTIGVNWFDKENDYQLTEEPDFFCRSINELSNLLDDLIRRQK